MTSNLARRMALGLRRRGLLVPARLLAEAHRPLGPLLDDLGAAAGPLFGAVGARGAERLLSETGMLEDVITELEAAEDPDGRPR